MVKGVFMEVPKIFNGKKDVLFNKWNIRISG